VLDVALDPEPTRRPSVGQLLAWLRGQGPAPVARGVSGPVPPGPRVPEPVETMPLSLFPEESPEHPDDGGYPERAEPTRVESAPWDLPAPAPAAPTLGERTRRTVLVAATGLAAAAGLAAYPWAALAILLVLVWLLRTGSIAASTVGERRQLRGARWYDGPRLVLGAPWDLARSAPATLLLGLWAFGLAVAAILVCYAVDAALGTTLAVAGVVLVGGLWWGPGGDRLRSPVDRVARSLSRGMRGWLVAVCVVAAVGGLLGGLAAGGADWLPASGPPFSGLAR